MRTIIRITRQIFGGHQGMPYQLWTAYIRFNLFERNHLLLCCHHYLEYVLYDLFKSKSIFFYMHEGKNGCEINFIEIFFLPRLKHSGEEEIIFTVNIYLLIVFSGMDLIQRLFWTFLKIFSPEMKLPTSAGSWKKQESSRKTSISALLTMPKPLTV